MAKLYCYDPRDPRQSPDDPRSWRKTDNPALLLAHSIASRGLDFVDAGLDFVDAKEFWRRVAERANAVEAVI